MPTVKGCNAVNPLWGFHSHILRNPGAQGLFVKSLASLFTFPVISRATGCLHSSFSSFISRLLKLLPKMFLPLIWHWICSRHWGYSRPDLPFQWMGKLPRQSTDSSSRTFCTERFGLTGVGMHTLLYPKTTTGPSWIFHVVDILGISHSSVALR